MMPFIARAVALLAFTGALATPAQAHDVTADITRKSLEDQALVQVLEPAACSLRSSGRWSRKKRFDAPAIVTVRPHRRATLRCELPSGARWEHTFRPQAGDITVIELKQRPRRARGRRGGPPRRPAQPPPEPVVHPMEPHAFESFLGALDHTSFSSDQLDLIRATALANHFTVQQVGRVLERLSFSDDRVEAVRIMHPHVLDPENAHLLQSKTTFSRERREIMAIFGAG